MRRFIFLLFLVVSGYARADYVWTDRCRQAYQAVFDLNFNKAAKLLSEEKAANPGNLVTVYIENQSDFFKTFISEETTVLDVLKENTEKRITRMQKGPDNKFKKLFIGEMYLQLAIGRLKFEEWFSAANDIRRANKFLNENHEKYPAFAANLRGLGFIHSVAGTIPKNYQWITNMLGISGTVNQGLGELETLLEKTRKDPELSYLENETILLLSFLELSLDKKQQSTEKIRRRFATVEDIESQPLLIFSKSIFHMSVNENDSVIQLLSTRKKDPNAYPLHYLEFMEGTARMNKMDMSADKCFANYLNFYKGKSYVYSAWQRRAWLKLLQNDVKGYQQMMLHCKGDDKDDALTDEDVQALKDARNGVIPNVILLRARLYFDGGYYSQALNSIAGQPSSTFATRKDQLELTYRMARIFDETDKDDKAIEYYLQTYQNGKSTTYYYAANSSLMLGKLYEEKGDKKKALEYYKLTLELDNHDYQNSIDHKAKAGISRLE